MKKVIVLGLIALNISIFAATKQEIPEDIEKAIIRESQSFEGSDRMSFRRWQTESYLKMEKMGEECGISKNKTKIERNVWFKLYKTVSGSSK